ncbi:hypothetical protein GVO57_09380 [Sphingomonas changnyeongensis]|uniref:Uncharacterized protein n=1 Tax=Sphingomonas changnyeongensis TaxID=2698679 RepID=A0A7Z2NW87_9SPHN|nr:hypothetical protein [Sphingomonas changnyeongensis]QHL90993.1 hypothetical protein GVO57_09380 [Sphingomonas changnyeongensis]
MLWSAFEQFELADCYPLNHLAGGYHPRQALQEALAVCAVIQDSFWEDRDPLSPGLIRQAMRGLGTLIALAAQNVELQVGPDPIQGGRARTAPPEPRSDEPIRGSENS